MNSGFLMFSCCLCQRNIPASVVVQFPCCNPSPHFCYDCMMTSTDIFSFFLSIDFKFQTNKEPIARFVVNYGVCLRFWRFLSKVRPDSNITGIEAKWVRIRWATNCSCNLGTTDPMNKAKTHKFKTSQTVERLLTVFFLKR